jgi:nicotinamidase-related amidase
MGRELDGPLGPGCVHVAVDCQRMFLEQTDWHVPWMGRVLPMIARITEAHPDATIFTRFIPPRHPGEARGAWRRYYQRWSSMTIEKLGEAMLDLPDELRRFVPPAQIADKHVYSPWLDGELEKKLKARRADTLVVTGGETDVCVLATILGAVDLGYRVVVATDALCSSSDETHDSSLRVFEHRFGQQVEAVKTADILAAWT